MRHIRKRMLIRFDDAAICEDVYMRDEYGINILLMSRQLRKVVDVGAHIGSFTMKVADHMGKDARIISIEPHPENFEILKLNAARTPNPETITLVHAAVTNSPSKSSAFLTDKLKINTGGSVVRGVSRNNLGESGPGSIEVQSVYLPELLDQQGFDSVDIIKFDCEGCELAGIRSLVDTGWISRIKHIKGEYHGNLGEPLRSLMLPTHTVRVYNKSGALGKFSAELRK